MKTKWPGEAYLASTLIWASMFILGASVSARADVVTTFDATGVFADGATLSGTLTIDTTAGTVSAVDLIMSSPDDLAFTDAADSVYTYNAGYGGYYIAVPPTITSSPLTGLIFLLDATSLVGYSGGVIYSTSDRSPTGFPSGMDYANTSFVGLASGSLTSEPLPEPGSLALLGTGLAGLGLLRRHRAKADAQGKLGTATSTAKENRPCVTFMR